MGSVDRGTCGVGVEPHETGLPHSVIASRGPLVGVVYGKKRRAVGGESVLAAASDIGRAEDNADVDKFQRHARDPRRRASSIVKAHPARHAIRGVSSGFPPSRE